VKINTDIGKGTGTAEQQWEDQDAEDFSRIPAAGGRVLRNNLGMRCKREMDTVEYEALLHTQEAALEELTLRT